MLLQRSSHGIGFQSGDKRDAEEGASRSSQRLGVGRTGGILHKDYSGSAKCLGRAHCGAGIAGILQAVQNQHQTVSVKNLLQGPARGTNQRHHALAGFGGGNGREQIIGQKNNAGIGKLAHHAFDPRSVRFCC